MRILLIEDDAGLCQALSFHLEKNGYSADICRDGADASYYIEQNIYDLILLDRMLPHVDGLTILQNLRARGNVTPVIFLTALGEVGDRVDGLDAGADDYLVKPFQMEELLARVRVMERRPRKWQPDSLHRFGDLSYSPEENILQGPGGSCTLSRREGTLLDFLLRNQTQILPRLTLLARVWGPDAEVEEGNLDNYMYFLRRRLRGVGSHVTIRTIRGVGYQLEQ